ncbi:MAG: hypothetical protein ABI638_12205 [Ignavibacteriota bacterium]
MADIYQCKNCGALIDKNSLICWFCNTFLDKGDIAKGRIKNSKTYLPAKKSDHYIRNEKIEKINFHNSNIDSKGVKVGLYIY